MRYRPFALALVTSALLSRPTFGQAIKRSCAGGQTLPCFIGQSVENVQDFGVSVDHHLLWHVKNVPGGETLVVNFSPSSVTGLAYPYRFQMQGHTELCSCGTFPCNWLVPPRNPSCLPAHTYLDEENGQPVFVIHDSLPLRFFQTRDGVPCTCRAYAHLVNSGQALYWDLTADPEVFIFLTELGPGDTTVFEGFGQDLAAGDFLCAGAGRAPFSRVSPSSIAIGQVISGSQLFLRDNQVEVKVDGHAVWHHGGNPEQEHFFLGQLPDASGPRLLGLSGGPPLPAYDHCHAQTCTSLAPGTQGNVAISEATAVQGSVTMNHLQLSNGARLWVNGDLTINAGISAAGRSRGAIFVNGDLVVRGIVNLEAEQDVAIQAQGETYLCGVKGAYTTGPCATGAPAQPGNLDFTTDLVGWGTEGSATAAFSTLDASGSPSSGSAYVTNPGTFPDDLPRGEASRSPEGSRPARLPNEVRVTRPLGGGPPLLGGSATGHGIDQPCIAVTPGQAYDVSVKVRIPAGQPSTGRGRATVTWFNDAVCFSRAGTSQTPAVSPPNGAWQTTSLASVVAPPGAQRAILGLTVEKDDPEQDFVAQFDDASFAPAAVPYGNLNGDVAIDVFDLVTMSNHIVGNAPQGAPPFVAPLAAADVNRSGLVDVFDLVVLAGFIVGNVPSLPL